MAKVIEIGLNCKVQINNLKRDPFQGYPYAKSLIQSTERDLYQSIKPILLKNYLTV